MADCSTSRRPISIRAATLADAALLARLGRDTFAATFAADNAPDDLALYLSKAFGPEVQSTELADPRSHFLIAEADAEAVGYARLLEGDAPAPVSGVRPLEIVRLYTMQAWIGRGIGAALMRASLDAARRLGCDTVWLGVWEKNWRAIAFYQRWGFRQVGAHDFLLGQDLQTDWLMERAVAEPGAAGSPG